MDPRLRGNRLCLGSYMHRSAQATLRANLLVSSHARLGLYKMCLMTLLQIARLYLL